MHRPDTHLLLRALVDELARCGLRHAVTSPGSRNTPLVLALVRDERLAAHSVIDERSAGFLALGAAKASGLPVALTCTSGTAAANLAPAVIEAHHARVPLIVLTGDRPPELREVGAGQAIDQVKLFGSAVRWFFEVGVHEASPERIQWVRSLACRAYWTALGPVAGPVHLNFPLREPLVPDGPLGEDPAPGRLHGRPWVARAQFTDRRTAAYVIEQQRPVFVAGAGVDGAAVAQTAELVGAPLLADPMSGARRGRAAVAHYDLLLRSEPFIAAHRPDLVVRLGELPTSKPLRSWLASLDGIEHVAVDPDQTWQDPDARVSQRVEALSQTPGAAADPAWLPAWRDADRTVAETIERELGDGLSEPLVAASLSRWLPSEATFFVASSMPIRDVETFAPALDGPPRVLANRGANGIDGTISSALGAALVSRGPVVLLIGDVALAHDIGGLLSARRLGINLTIVLLNNDGGGIFHFLPVAGRADAFETHVATPHGLDFARVASLYGCAYSVPPDLTVLHRTLDAAMSADTTTIIEIRTDRAANLALHRRTVATVVDSAG